MLEPFRSDFNRRYAPEEYQRLLARLDEATRSKITFRVSETPCFFPKELLDRMAAIGTELTQQLVGNPGYMKTSETTVPEQYRVPMESSHPHFMTADFGLVRDADGVLQPMLVELQAFPSIFGYQSVLAPLYIEMYGLDPSLRWLLGGLDEEGFWALLRRVILGDLSAENVVLTEIEPETQKTLPDFRVYEDRLGIATVDIAKVRKQGRQLFYQKSGEGGRWIPIRRIYNRAIVDELERKKITLGFDYRDDLDVEWAGHPNWYFRISKFSLPFLRHASVPPTVFLDDWYKGAGRENLSAKREDILLKPLYSFAGRGIQFAPTDEDLASIPEAERSLYLLQKRVHFEPIIATPYGKTQAEVRILYLWPEGGTLTPALSLVRMGRGLMMGVDHNRDEKWVGGSAALFVG